jgi:tetratricopeptide (TPR) repeat protein
LNTKQYAVIVIAFTLIGTIYFFGNRKYPMKKIMVAQQNSITVESLLQQAENQLNNPQKNQLQKLQAELLHAGTDSAKIVQYEALIDFWGREVNNEELAVWYFAQKAKLENSEKYLTFAANFILNNCITDDGDPFKRGFKAKQAKELFEKALLLNPEKDSLIIGLGGCYMLGGGGSASPMDGISKVLGIVRKDSTNAYAHKMLGYGNLQNGQTNQALERFIKAYNYNKEDIGLVPYIALLSKKLGKTAQANLWLEKTKLVFADKPELVKKFETEFQSSK